MKTFFNQPKIPLLLIPISLSGIFLYQYLTFIPGYSHADSISTTNPIKTLADIEYMDEVTPEICGNTPLADTEGNHQYPLKDPRDNQTYTVAKLKDGNCWMTQNMNNPEGRSHKEPEYGGYYTREYNNSQKACNIAKWSLPTKEQYDELLTSYNIENSKTGSSALRSNPLNFLYGGYYYNNVINNINKVSDYWTSTQSGNLTYRLRIEEDRALVNGMFGNYGLSVRCLTSGNGTINPPIPSSPRDPNISVKIPNILTLDVNNPTTIPTSTDEVNTVTFTATVESNQNYNISLNATSDSTALINTKDGHKLAEIPTITTAQPTPGTSSWGIRVCTTLLESSCDSALYQPLPAKNQTNTFITGTKGAHQHLFQIGIGISPSLPSGTYSTSILVTASQN